MKKKEFVFLALWNLWHSEVSWKILREQMIEGGEVLRWLKNVRVPIYFPMHACDASFLAVACPEIIQEIRRNPFIKVVRSTYCHVMPSVFPGTMPEQLRLGNAILEYHFGKDKIESRLGFVSDFNVCDAMIPSLIDAGWKGAIVLQDMNNVYELSRSSVGDIIIPNPLSQNIMKHFHRDFGLFFGAQNPVRNGYLGYFRNFGTPEDVIGILAAEAEKNEGLGIFLTDFEPPWICGVNGQSKIDDFNRLMTALAETEQVKFVHLEDSEVIPGLKIQANASIRERILFPKWHHSRSAYVDIVNGLQKMTVSDRQNRYKYYITVSDTASATYWPEVRNGEAVFLPINGSEEKIRIYGDVDNRVDAMKYFLGKLNGQSYEPRSEEAKWFLGIVEQAITLEMQIMGE